MVFTFDMLYDAWKETVTQNSEQPNKARFKYYIAFNLTRLLCELNSGDFFPQPFRSQRVYIPKEREVQIPALRDKIVQHVICDNYLNTALTRPLIKETSACLKGRGTLYGSDIVTAQLHNYYTHHGTRFYVLKCDIKSYFATIPHKRLTQLINRYVPDPDVRRIMKRFIRQTKVGLTLGLRQSQLLANLYLSELDHMCKEKLGAKYYGRYMDDFYIISDDIEYLQRCWKEIDAYVQSIGLTLNPKTTIMQDKLEFIGFTYSLTSTGKVLQFLNQQKKRSKKRHISKMICQIQSGAISVPDMVESYGCWRSHALQGDCYQLVSSWDKLVQDAVNQLGYTLTFNEMRWTLCQKQSRN